MSAENTASEKAKATPRVVGAPPLTVEADVKAGPGQKVVTSPTGVKSVVEEDAVDMLLTQGYKAG